MTIELRDYFNELAMEFNAIQHKVMYDRRISNGYRMGSYPALGTQRYNKGFSIQSEACFKSNLLTQSLRIYTRSFTSSQKIFDYFVREGIWPLTAYDINTDFNASPSISQNIISGFLVRNFEINEYKLVCTSESIKQTLVELDDYLNRDYVEFKSLLALHGPSGTLEKLSLTEDLFLRKADFFVTRLFGLYYSDLDDHYIDMFEGDYILDCTFRVPKKDLFSITSIEDSTFNNWFHVPLLAKTGNIEMGKRIRISKDWPLVLTSAIHIAWQKANLYSIHNQSQYVVEIDDINDLNNIASNIKEVDFTKLDDRIKYSIERLRKAKACRDINDRIVELALALEYLINTSSYEVTLQLSLKPVKLLSDDNSDPIIHQSLRKFYSLRSKVVHGNTKINNDPKNMSIIDAVEKIIQQMILRFMELNKKYSFKQINEALEKALYISRPLLEILEKH